MGFERNTTAYKRILVDGSAMGYQGVWVIRGTGYSKRGSTVLCFPSAPKTVSNVITFALFELEHRYTPRVSAAH